MKEKYFFIGNEESRVLKRKEIFDMQEGKFFEDKMYFSAKNMLEGLVLEWMAFAELNIVDNDGETFEGLLECAFKYNEKADFEVSQEDFRKCLNELIRRRELYEKGGKYFLVKDKK